MWAPSGAHVLFLRFSTFNQRSAPLSFIPLWLSISHFVKYLKPEDGRRGPKCAMGYHENKSRAVRPCLSVIYRKLPVTFNGSSTHAADWCIGSAVTEVVSHMLCVVRPGVGKELARTPSWCFVSAPKRVVISFWFPFERRTFKFGIHTHPSQRPRQQGRQKNLNALSQALSPPLEGIP